jgi:hypothetical protein
MKNQYLILGDITQILVIRKNGTKIPVLISSCDLNRVLEFPNSWCVMWCPDKNGFYVRSTDEEIIKFIDDRLQKINKCDLRDIKLSKLGISVSK